jgi:hypothetical protein
MPNLGDGNTDSDDDDDVDGDGDTCEDNNAGVNIDDDEDRIMMATATEMVMMRMKVIKIVMPKIVAMALIARKMEMMKENLSMKSQGLLYFCEEAKDPPDL